MPDLSNLLGFQRHISACTNAVLPGSRLCFRIGPQRVGWVEPALAEALAGFPAIRTEGRNVTLTDANALPEIARTLSERGFYRWRRETFDVRAEPDGPVLARIDRGAIPSFGIRSVGAHVNGIVERADEPHLWIARRARNKQLDPGKLDHIVAGGVPAGMTPFETLIKEAGEEAAVPPDLAGTARAVGQIGYAMVREEGLRRDLLHCYDLVLPEDFIPHPEDDEVEAFELWPIRRVMEAVRDTDDFKFNVNLVLIDLFIRRRLIAGAEADALRAALAEGAERAISPA
ncbi:MAG: DUF4743 domain-containing protein [Acetobacteraceae bacterium]